MNRIYLVGFKYLMIGGLMGTGTLASAELNKHVGAIEWTPGKPVAVPAQMQLTASRFSVAGKSGFLLGVAEAKVAPPSVQFTRPRVVDPLPPRNRGKGAPLPTKPRVGSPPTAKPSQPKPTPVPLALGGTAATTVPTAVPAEASANPKTSRGYPYPKPPRAVKPTESTPPTATRGHSEKGM